MASLAKVLEDKKAEASIKKLKSRFGGVEVTVERDDRGELGAVIYTQDQLTCKLPERDLLETVGRALTQVIG